MSKNLRKDYQRMRAPAALGAELVGDYQTRAKPGSFAPAAAMASFVLVAAAALFVPRDQGDERVQTLPSPAAVTAYTGELGQLSVSRLSLPAKPDLSGVTRVPTLPPAPSIPTTF